MSTSFATAATDGVAAEIGRLADLLRSRGPAVLLTGAGCSTASGIPDYRDRNGRWKQSRPMQHQEFLNSESARRRYWGRSALGWPPLR